MRRLTLFFCIAVVAAQSLHAQPTVTSSPSVSVSHPDAADPEHDCTQAISRYDLRFVGVAGYALDVPGVPDYETRYWKTNGVKVMRGTGDVGDRVFNESARKYARRYNLHLLKYLSTHRASNAKT